MRVALCFSGQLRNVKSTFDGWYKPNVIDANSEHQIDVFVHSWYDNSTVGKVYYAANHNPTYQPANVPIPTDVIQQVYESYNPVKLELERPKNFDINNYNTRKLIDANPQHGMSRLYSLLQSVKIKSQYENENHFKYDVVACARYDFMFGSAFNFNIVNADGVYHPGYSPHGFNVCYAMGNSTSMDMYANLYNVVDDVYNTGINWCDEILAKQYLEMNNIAIHNFSVQTNINRG